MGLIGRNGSGKSTLLKIAAGVYKPTSGKVTVSGTLAPLIELGAGFHHELTGRENILLNGLLMGYSKNEMKDRENNIIEFAEIGEFIDSPVKQYSSGMYMRLAFAVATEVDPEILLIDEILAVGDTSFQQKCFDRIRDFQKAGKTILLVSHAMGQIEKHCDHRNSVGTGCGDGQWKAQRCNRSLQESLDPGGGRRKLRAPLPDARRHCASTLLPLPWGIREFSAGRSAAAWRAVAIG